VPAAAGVEMRASNDATKAAAITAAKERFELRIVRVLKEISS